MCYYFHEPTTIWYKKYYAVVNGIRCSEKLSHFESLVMLILVIKISYFTQINYTFLIKSEWILPWVEGSNKLIQLNRWTWQSYYPLQSCSPNFFFCFELHFSGSIDPWVHALVKSKIKRSILEMGWYQNISITTSIPQNTHGALWYRYLTILTSGHECMPSIDYTVMLFSGVAAKKIV